uniref:PPM-type phosphatase domain-containing protein n=1 Tax=Heterorhabditis bacteriophora TaxID=37862 RepID=A0A1I7X2V7_HETBA
MSSYPIVLLITTAISTTTLLIHHRNLRYFVVRTEMLEFLIFSAITYLYIWWLVNRLTSRIKGLNLVYLDLEHHLKFNPPEFIDKGFSDLSKYEQFWKMRHNIFSYCATQGFRSYMEDRMHYMFDPNMNLSIFGIFDGHGGMALVVEIHRLDDSISRLDSNYTSLTGSTMIAVIMENNRYLTIINVGDSRAVACDCRNRAVPLSKDHKPDDPFERRRIELAGGFVSFDGSAYRVQGILAVSRKLHMTSKVTSGVAMQHCIKTIKTLKYVSFYYDTWHVLSQEMVEY